MSLEQFDYIIIGAGSAGCVLAHRLTEDPDCRVALVEAGGSDRSVYVDIPSGFWMLRTNPRFDWGYTSQPAPGLQGRRMLTPRGRAIGGSSTINGQMYIRGHPLDFENWVELGAPGWSYRDVLPYFKRAERFEGGGDAYRGDRGPLRTTRAPLGNPLYRAFLDAAEESGYPRTADLNGYQLDGFGTGNMTVARGKRCSAAHAYVHPIRGRSNLEVMTETTVERIVIEGNRASGVIGARAGVSVSLQARREVILSAGAVNSPQLLMLSGIGPGPALQSMGIAVQDDLKGVGENLMDHVSVRVQHQCLQPVSRQSVLKPVNRLATGLRWLLTKSGVAASNQFEAGGYLRTGAGMRWPDLQADFIPFALTDGGERAPMAHGFQTYVSLCRPMSRGTVRLHSADPTDHPEIQCNYLARQEDCDKLRTGIGLLREITAQPAFDAYRGPETRPGPAAQSNEELDAYIRETAQTVYHLTGTCRMGNGADAVVDAQGRVHGLAALRVVDASLMPQITSSNTNAATIMIAEKIADAIRGQPPLPAAEVDYYEMPDWQTKQRPQDPKRALPTT